MINVAEIYCTERAEHAKTFMSNSVKGQPKNSSNGLHTWSRKAFRQLFAPYVASQQQLNDAYMMLCITCQITIKKQTNAKSTWQIRRMEQQLWRPNK